MDDAFIEFIAGCADRSRIGHAAQRKNTNFSRTAANIDNHRTCRIFNRQACAQSGSHRFFNQMYACRAGSKRRIQNRFTFHLGRAARNTDNHTRRNQRSSFGGFFNQHTQHTLGNHKIGNYTVPHRTDDFNIARRTTLHFFGFRAHGYNFTFIACAGLNRNHGRLI